MFVGRSKELAKLNKMYQSHKFEMAVIYGRRRVGKTTLIQEFCKDKRAIYSVGREINAQGNLECISKDIYHVLDTASENSSVFKDWERVLTYIEAMSKDERLVLVLDEYPYYASSCPELSSILQAHIDNALKTGKLFLILCGSSMSFMEHQVLGYKSPLYGRRTAQFRITPFSFVESRLLLQNFTKEEQAIFYAVTGGIPEYLAHIDNKLTLKENIINLFLDDNGVLYEEPGNLLKQELRDPTTYNDIIGAIAKGASRLSEIAGKSHMESNKCGKYLNSLIELGIVEKEKPVTEEHSKKSIYKLCDQMFRFWYYFVPDNASRIVSGDGEQVYRQVVQPAMPQFMGSVFEQICLEYFSNQTSLEKTPFFFQKIGRWWGNNPQEKRQEEIDLIAYFDDSAAFGECKWRNEKVGLEILQELKRKSELFNQFSNRWYYVFSKSGFTKGAVEYAENHENWQLVAFEEM